MAILGGVILLFLLWYFNKIVAYILLSFIVSLIGQPLVRILSKLKIKKFHLPLSICSLITLLLFWAIFLGFFSFFIPLLVREFQSLSKINVQPILASIDAPFRQFLKFTAQNPADIDHKNIEDLLTGELKKVIDFSKISVTVGTLISAIGEIGITIFAVSFISFFFLKDENMFLRGIQTCVPSQYEERTKRVVTSIIVLLRRYFTGLLIEIFLIISLITIGLLIVGIDFSHAVVIAMICGFLNVIPYLGPWLGAFIGLMIGTVMNIQMNFYQTTLPLLGGMLIVFACVHLIDNILFQPLIYSNSVKAHPLEIFLVIFAAGSVGGIIGMVVAIPVYTFIRVVAKEFLGESKIVQKLTQNIYTKQE